MDGEIDIDFGASIIDSYFEAISSANFVLVFSSKRLVNSKTVYREVRQAIRQADLRPNSIYLIPLRIDDSPILKELMEYQHLDLRNETGFQQINRYPR